MWEAKGIIGYNETFSGSLIQFVLLIGSVGQFGAVLGSIWHLETGRASWRQYRLVSDSRLQCGTFS